MKISPILFLGAIGMMAQTQVGAATRVDAVTVYVRPGFSDSRLRLPCAEYLASTIFENAGVHVQWRIGQPQPRATKGVIVIEMTMNTPRTFHTGALAYAQPFEGEHIRIFWDRVTDTADDRLVTKLLAHVMVHEITHVLEGVNHHSPEGIMKAHWTERDLAELKYQSLSFDREDVGLIQDGMAKRGGRTRSAARVGRPPTGGFAALATASKR